MLYIYYHLKGPGGGGELSYESDGDAHVSIRGVNCRFWSHLGCSGQKANICTHTGIA